MEGARYPDLKGLPVLVTGGGSGIGASIVAHFAAQGARVGALEINPEAAQRTRQAVQQERLRSPPVSRLPCRTIRSSRPGPRLPAWRS